MSFTENTLTKIDIIQAYIEMKMRDLDMERELIRTGGGILEEKKLDEKSIIKIVKAAYGDIYKFIASIELKQQQIRERNKIKK